MNVRRSTLTPAAAAQTAARKAGARQPGNQVMLKLPALDQFRLQQTWWEARWEPAILKAFAESRRSRAAASAGTALGTAVYRANSEGMPPTTNRVRAVERAHQRLVAALRSAGCPAPRLRRLERCFRTYVSWWRQSGRRACALAAEKLLRLAGAAGTGIGPVHSGARRTLVRKAPWYPALRSTPGAPDGAKLYKGRAVTYDVRYRPERLRQVAAAIIAKLNAGEPVHLRVLTGYLHRDAGAGRPPRATHSLVVTGYQVLSRRGPLLDRVAFRFRDPDGGGQSTLVLDATQGRFGQRPAHPSWERWSPDGWRYGASLPPHYRYQVLSVR